MAEILQGNSDQTTYAPLSQAQTIAICKHLQQEIRQVEQTLSEVQRETHRNTEFIDKLKTKSGEKREDIHLLQMGFADTNAKLEKMCSEQGRNVENVAQLQANDRQTRDRLVQMDEQEQLMNMHLQTVMRDLGVAKAEDERLRTDIEKRIDQELMALRKEFASTCLKLNQVDNEQKQTAELEKQVRDSVRKAEAELMAVNNAVQNANTEKSILMERLERTAKGVVENNGRFKDLDDKLIKINECYDKTRARVQENEGKIKEVRDDGLRTNNTLEDLVRKVGIQGEKIQEALTGLEDECNSTEEMRHQINAQRQSCDMLQRGLQQVTHEMIQTAESTRALRAGMKEQSSLLLPNINMDSPEAAAAAGRHGSLLMGSPMSPGGRSASTRTGASSLRGVSETESDVWSSLKP